MTQEITSQALAQLRPGDHLAFFYETKEKQVALIVPFLQAGLQGGEKCLYIAAENSPAEIEQALSAQGIDVASYIASGKLSILTAAESYLRGGTFDPEKMLSLLQDNLAQALGEGFTGLRVAGEMTWALATPQGRERLAEYEAKLNSLPGADRLLFLCQYNLSRFSPHLLLAQLRTHPLLLHQGQLCRNEYYVSLEESLTPEKELTRQLTRLAEKEKEGQRDKEHLQVLEKALADKGALLQQRVVGNLALDLVSLTLMEGADLERVCRTVVQKVRQIMEVDEAHVWMARGELLVICCGDGASPDFYESEQAISWGECLCGRAAEDGKAIISDNLAQDPRVSQKNCLAEGFSCRLSIPLLWQGKVTGVFSIARRSSRPFSSQEQELFNSIAYQLSIAVENSRLHSLAEEKAARLARMLELSQAVTSSLEIQQVHDTFVWALRQEGIEIDWGNISFISRDKLQVVALGGVAPPWKVGVDTPIAGTASEWIREHHQPHLNPDLAKERHFWTDKIAFKYGTRSVLRYPMFYQGELFAVLSLGSSRPQAYGHREVAIVGQFIDYLSIAAYNARLFAEAQERRKRLEALSRITRAITSSLKLEEVWEAFATEMKKLLDFDQMRINLIQGDKLEIMAMYPEGKSELGKGSILPLAGTASEWVAQQRQSSISADLAQTRQFWTDEIFFREGIKSVIRLPLFSRGEVFGTLTLHSTRPRAYGEREKEFLEDVAGQVAIAVQNSLLYQKTLELSLQDSLTGLLHHREFYRRLEEEVKRAQRYSHPLSLLIVDLDRFKETNESYGHQAGDMVLREVSTHLVEKSRSTDIVARYGGDEFALILPETDKEGAIELAQRLVEATKQEVFGGGKVRLTLSIGIAIFPQNGASAETLVGAADEAMFRAKEQGGNRLQPAGER